MGSGMGSQTSMPLTEAASGSSVLDWTDGTRHVAVTEAVRRPIVATVLSHVSPDSKRFRPRGLGIVAERLAYKGRPARN